MKFFITLFFIRLEECFEHIGNNQLAMTMILTSFFMSIVFGFIFFTFNYWFFHCTVVSILLIAVYLKEHIHEFRE